MSMKRILSFALCLLSACAAERPAPRPAQPAAAAPVSARPPAVARPPQFDGVYKGLKTALVAGGPGCASRGTPRNLVVQDGLARLVWNPGLGSSFAGNVAPDGTLNMSLDDQRVATSLVGSINGAQASARTSIDDCGYEMTWRKSR